VPKDVLISTNSSWLAVGVLGAGASVVSCFLQAEIDSKQTAKRIITFFIIVF
jgi:hypothetical protein